MAFNPQVDNFGPQLVAMGQQMRLRQSEKQNDAMADIVAMMGSNVAKAGSAYTQNLAMQRNNVGKLEALGSLGLLPADKLDEISAIKDPSKQAGALAVVEDAYQMQQRKSLLDHEYALRAGLQQTEQAGDRTGTTTTMTDPVTGRQVGGYFQNNRQVVPFQTPGNAMMGSAGVKRVDLGNGAYVMVDQATGKAIPTSAIQQPKPNPLVDNQIATLTTQAAGLQGQLAKDPNARTSWTPWSESASDALKGVNAQIERLQGSSGIGSTVGQAEAAPAGPMTISADLASKQLGRKVTPGQKLKDKNGNIIIVQ